MIRVDDDIQLRPVAVTDAETLFGLIDGNRTHLGRWLPWVEGVLTVGDERKYCENAVRADGEGREQHFVIVYRNELVGGVGVTLDPLNMSAEFGYWLAEDAQGKGLVTRSCRALLKHLFEEWGLNRVQALVAEGNKRSMAVLERLHFVREGVQREAGIANGEFTDMVVFSMLASEWKGLSQPHG